MWYGRLRTILGELEVGASPWVDSEEVACLLGVSRRRAQQILAPCVQKRLGLNGLAGRREVVERLRQVAEGDEAGWERIRRAKVAREIGRLADEPHVFVEAPAAVRRQRLDDLPDGVVVERGRIEVRFRSVEEALEKLLALAMAIGNDPGRLAELVEG